MTVDSRAITDSLRARLLSRRPFAADAAVSLGGSVIARLVTLASLPFITRIYGASEYGIWVIILAVGSFFLPFATLRYELAVVLAPTRRIAGGLVLAIGVFTVFAATGLALSFMVANEQFIRAITGLEVGNHSIILIAPIVLIVLAAQLGIQAWATRECHFALLSVGQLTQAIVTFLLI